MNSKELETVFFAETNSLDFPTSLNAKKYPASNNLLYASRETLFSISKKTPADYLFLTDNSHSIKDHEINDLLSELANKQAQLGIFIQPNNMSQTNDETLVSATLRYPRWCCSPQNALYELLSSPTAGITHSYSFMLEKGLLASMHDNTIYHAELPIIYALINSATVVCFLSLEDNSENKSSSTTYSIRSILIELAARQKVFASLLDIYPKLETCFFANYYKTLDLLKEVTKQNHEEELDPASVAIIRKIISPFFKRYISLIKKHNHISSRTQLATKVFLSFPKIYARFF